MEQAGGRSALHKDTPSTTSLARKPGETESVSNATQAVVVTVTLYRPQFRRGQHRDFAVSASGGQVTTETVSKPPP